MMCLNPCCGGSLQTGTKMVAIFQIIVAVFSIFFAILLCLCIVLVNMDNTGITGNETTININGSTVTGDEETIVHILAGAFDSVEITILFIIGIVCLTLGVVLIKGAQQKNIRKCNFWLILQYIVLVFSQFLVVWEMYSSREPYQLAFGGVKTALDLYFIWIVETFIKNLKHEESRRGAYAPVAVVLPNLDVPLPTVSSSQILWNELSGVRNKRI